MKMTLSRFITAVLKKLGLVTLKHHSNVCQAYIDEVNRARREYRQVLKVKESLGKQVSNLTAMLYRERAISGNKKFVLSGDAYPVKEN